MKRSGNKVFIDINVIIEVFKGNKLIADKISNSSGFYISSVVLGELYIGINRVVDKEKHLRRLNAFFNVVYYINGDLVTARIFGEITASLYKKGKPIPSNDVWIAASVKQHDLKLISQDKHFEIVDDILLESW